MTPQRSAALEEELKQLKTVDRPRITAAIAEAREHGDKRKCRVPCCPWAAKGFLNSYSRYPKYQIGRAEVIDPQTTAKDGRVVFGVTVVIENLDTENKNAIKLWVMTNGF